MPQKQRKVHYRRAQLRDGQQVDLQVLIARAITGIQDVEDRLEGRDTDNLTKRVISGVGAHMGMLTAKLLQFTDGQQVQFLEKDPATGDFRINAMGVPGTTTAQRKAFVESLTFLCVSAHHVMFVATLHLGAKAIEEHLNWLLKLNGTIPADQYVLLIDQQSEDAELKIRESSIDKVIVGADLEYEVLETVPSARRTKTREGVKGHKTVRPVGPVRDAIVAWFGETFGDHSFHQALNKEDRVHVKIELSYSSRNKTSEGFALMKDLAVAARHLDADECTIRLHDGAVLKGDDLRVEKSISITISDAGIVDEGDLWAKVLAQLNIWVTARVIR